MLYRICANHGSVLIRGREEGRGENQRKALQEESSHLVSKILKQSVPFLMLLHRLNKRKVMKGLEHIL